MLVQTFECDVNYPDVGRNRLILAQRGKEEIIKIQAQTHSTARSASQRHAIRHQLIYLLRHGNLFTYGYASLHI